MRLLFRENAMNIKLLHIILTLSAILFSNLSASEIKILAAKFKKSANNSWKVSVTLKHADTGWDHYTDGWRIVDSNGTTLANRVLRHPHVDDQPFTRALSKVKIPKEITMVYIEAHDKDLGWSLNRLEVDLSKAKDGQLIVEER